MYGVLLRRLYRMVKIYLTADRKIRKNMLALKELQKIQKNISLPKQMQLFEISKFSLKPSYGR